MALAMTGFDIIHYQRGVQSNLTYAASPGYDSLETIYTNIDTIFVSACHQFMPACHNITDLFPS